MPFIYELRTIYFSFFDGNFITILINRQIVMPYYLENAYSSVYPLLQLLKSG